MGRTRGHRRPGMAGARRARRSAESGPAGSGPSADKVTTGLPILASSRLRPSRSSRQDSPRKGLGGAGRCLDCGIRTIGQLAGVDHDDGNRTRPRARQFSRVRSVALSWSGVSAMTRAERRRRAAAGRSGSTGRRRSRRQCGAASRGAGSAPTARPPVGGPVRGSAQRREPRRRRWRAGGSTRASRRSSPRGRAPQAEPADTVGERHRSLSSKSPDNSRWSQVRERPAVARGGAPVSGRAAGQTSESGAQVRQIRVRANAPGAVHAEHRARLRRIERSEFTGCKNNRQHAQRGVRPRPVPSTTSSPNSYSSHTHAWEGARAPPVLGVQPDRPLDRAVRGRQQPGALGPGRRREALQPVQHHLGVERARPTRAPGGR